jgi:DNA-directed RNA polymerase subunit M/transcription elongation factor TFIIS
MSEPIVCNGCGGRLTVPDDYARNKMQCPECGVMCVIPPRTAAKKKAAVPQPAEEPRFEEDEEPAAPRKPAKALAPFGKGPVACRSCGELVRPPARKTGKQGKCPVCGAAWPEPITGVKQKPASAPIPPPPDEFAGTTIDDDPDSGNPYGTADPGSRRCPECTEQLAPNVVVCVRCGFDLRQGRKLLKQFQRMDMRWDSGMSLSMRVTLFLVCQTAALTAIIAALATLDNPLHEAIATFAFSWMVYAAMTSFLLGTYDYFLLKRSKSGKTTLTRTWRIAFWPFPAREIDVRAYFSVISGAGEYANWWDWLIFCILLSAGIFPALLYWYFAIHKTEYFVGLCGEHEHLEEKVYRGWNRERMLEIQQTLRDAVTP